MDTPDKAAGLADSGVADAVNRDWLLASARSSQLSTDLARYHLDWSHESSSPTPLYGATAASHAGQPEWRPLPQSLPAYSSNRPASRTGGGSSSAPPAAESSWLMRHQFWPRRTPTGGLTRETGRATSRLSHAGPINGHLYDNISYAETPPPPQTARKTRRPADEADELSRCGRFRILLACFLLLGITLANYSRNALSLAAVGMMASNAINHELVDLLASGPAEPLEAGANLTGRLRAPPDGSCPIGDHSPLAETPLSSAAWPGLDLGGQRRAQLEAEFRVSVRRRVDRGELVDWTPGEQGLISAAGSVGNLLIAVPLTRLGEIYGPKWVIFVASLGAVVQAALMPLVSACNVRLVILFQLVFNGLTYGADCVAYTLFAHWLTPTEMAFFVSCLIICYQLGSMLSGFVTAKILSQGAAWSWCFYTPAILCAIWTAAWALVGASEPRASWLISRGELMYLNRNSKIALTFNQREQAPDGRPKQAGERPSAGSHPVSWLKLARDPNIWAIIAVKFTLRWYFSAYLSLMPTYLSSVGHMSVATIGSMSVAQSFVGLFAGGAMGFLTRSLASKRLLGLSLAATRKCFQSVVNFGLALSLLVFIVHDCNQWVAIGALTFGGLCVSFYVAAALQIPLDLSPTHCGLITSITNTLALGQALGAPLSGLILNGGPKERWRWRIVWGLAIVMNALSGLIFILLVDSKPRDYSKRAPDFGAEGGRIPAQQQAAAAGLRGGKQSHRAASPSNAAASHKSLEVAEAGP